MFWGAVFALFWFSFPQVTVTSKGETSVWVCVSNTSTYQASAKQGNAKIITDMSKSTTSLLIFNRLLCIGPWAYGGHFPSSHKTSFSGTLTRDLVPAYIYLFICLCFNSQLTHKTFQLTIKPQQSVLFLTGYVVLCDSFW